MAKITTLRDFSLYFTDKKDVEKAKQLADSDKWCIYYNTIFEEEEGEDYICAISFFWDDITLSRIQEFLDDFNKLD